MKREDEIRLVFSKRQLKGFLALAVLVGAAYALMSESFTLSTYYPAPSGVYNQMITTGNTYLARDGGNVGLGTTAPRAKLEIGGNAIAAYPSAADHVATKQYVDDQAAALRQYVNAQIAASLPTCPSGWTGASCATPICSPGCQNGGTCTAPNTCRCPTGYSGPTCASSCQSAVTAAGPCAPGVCCGACVDGNWFAYGSYCGTSSSDRCCWNATAGKGSCHYCR